MTVVTGSTRTLIASHRGGSLRWTENSLTAFRQTALLGVDQVELDVHLTRDREVVVMHDATLDRTTDRSGAIGDHSWEELRGVTLAETAGERPPHLEEVVAVFRDTAIDLRIEIKPDVRGNPYPGLEALTLEIVANGGMAGRCFVSSFQLSILRTVETVDSLVSRIWLVSRTVQKDVGLDEVASLARRHGVDRLSLHVAHCDRDDFGIVRDAGCTVGAYGAHTPERITRAFELGCDVFTTDDPVAALEIRDRRRQNT